MDTTLAHRAQATFAVLDPSLVALAVAVSVGVAMVAGAFAASLIIRATKDEIDPERL